MVKGALTLTLIILILIMLLYSPTVKCSPTAFIEASLGKGLKVRVDYELKVTEHRSVVISAGGDMSFVAPPPPKGFEVTRVELKVRKGLPPFIKLLDADKVCEVGGSIRSAIKEGSRITLKNIGTSNITLELDLCFVYLRSLEIRPKGNRVVIEVGKPGEPFTRGVMLVEASIDNRFPYAFSDILLPNGTSLLNIDVQRRLGADRIFLDLHHVRIRIGPPLPFGKYTLLLERGEEYSLPYSFIVKEGIALNESLPPYSSKEITFPRRGNGWRVIGYLLAVYGSRRVGEGVLDLKGTLVDYIYSGGDSIKVRSASYLIPPFTFSYWLDIYVIYGQWFKIENKGNNPLNIMYIPLTIRGVGYWNERGLLLSLNRSDLLDAKRAYLVVQLPSYGRIKAVIGPGNKDLTRYFESEVNILGMERGISVLDDQLYIEVKRSDAWSSITYAVLIDWKRLTVKALDSKGAPLKGAQIILKGPKELVILTNSDGLATLKIYAPGNYVLKVLFKGSEVYSAPLDAPYGFLEVPCRVYDIGIVTLGLMGQPLEGGRVILRKAKGGGIVAMGRTDKNGVTVLKEVPGGIYDLIISYKRFKMVFNNITVSGPLTLKAGLDVLFEIPYFNVPVSLKEAVGALGLPLTLITLRRLSKRFGKGEEEEVISVEE